MKSSPPPNEIHVWYIAPDRIVDRGLLDSYVSLLSAEERARHERLKIAHVRLEHLVTRAAVRTLLSRYLDRDPRDWTFEKNEYGRPAPVDPPAPIRFNISHTAGLIALAFSGGRELGIDVEHVDRRMTDLEDIARTHFAPSEVSELLSLPQDQRRARFFDYWTLKESYIKARGMGLSLPLEQFEFVLGEHAVSIRIDPRLNDAPSRWQFEQYRPTTGHKAALAVERTEGPDPSISIRWFVPGVD